MHRSTRQRFCRALRGIILLGVVAPTLVTASGACSPSTTGEDEPRRLYTLFEIQEALRQRTTLAAGAAFPQGIAPETILAAGAGGVDALKVSPAFSEGEPAAYVTTDLWVNVPEVWIQPWYVLITAWNDKPPRMNALRDPNDMTKVMPPLIDVGPKSAFYSPYWQIIYAVVPADSPLNKYTSSRQLFDEGVPLYPGTPWFYTVKPNSVGLVPAKPLHPILGQEIGGLSIGQSAIIEGQSVQYLNAGGNNFRFDEKLVVEEVPLFIFARRDANGAPARAGVPDVVGSSPLFSRRPAEVLNGTPRFGAFVRFHLAYLPATGGAFDPATAPNAVARLAALPTPVDPKIYQGRVAADVTCFAAETFPTGCRWLDSQQRIEDSLGRAGIERTAVTASTPLVFYGGKAIGAR